MNTFLRNLIKNIVVVACMVSLVGPSLTFAVAGVGDIVSDPVTNTETAITATESGTTAAAQTKTVTKEFSLDKIAQRLMAASLSAMTKSLLNWLNGGAKGNPLYVPNWGVFAGNVASVTSTAFVDALGNSTRKSMYTQIEKDAETACNQPPEGPIVDNSVPIELQVDLSSPNKYTPEQSALGCACGTQLDKRYAEETHLLTLSKAQLDNLLTTQGRTTTDEYLDIGFPLDKCDQFSASTGSGSDIRTSGGYKRDIVKFLGYAAQTGAASGLGSDALAQSGLPSFKTLPQETAQQVAQNWKRFEGDFSAGGWSAWDQVASPNNNPLSANFFAINNLTQKVNTQLAQTESQLQQNSGLLSVTRCKNETKKIILSDGRETCPDGLTEVVTPGKFVGDQVSLALGSSIRKTESAKEWGDIFDAAAGQLVSGLINVGLSKVNNGIGQLLDNAATPNSGLSGNIIAKNDVDNGNSAINAEEVVDIDQFLYGDPVKIQRKNADGSPMFEPVVDPITGKPTFGKDGKPLYDITRPVYEYEQLRDAQGNLVFEDQILASNPTSPTSPIGGPSKKQVPVWDYSKPKYKLEFYPKCVSGGAFCIPQVDPKTGEYLRDETKPKFNKDGTRMLRREGGALVRTQLMLNLLTADRQDIKALPQKLLNLDRCLPGPDLGWQDRLQQKFESIKISKSDAKDAIEVASLKEIGTAAYNIIDDYVNGIEQTRGRCKPGGSTFQSLYNLSGNPNAHLDCSSDNAFGMNDAQNLGATNGVINIPSYESSRALITSISSQYSQRSHENESKLTEMTSLLRSLKLLDTNYQAFLNNPDPAKPTPTQIARDIVALREDVPYTSMIERQAIFSKQTVDNGIALDEATATCTKELQQPEYFDLFFKDSLRVLYCPLQYHGIINTMDTQQKINLLNQVSGETNFLATGGGMYLMSVLVPFYGTANLLFNHVATNPKDLYKEALSHPDPDKAKVNKNDSGWSASTFSEFMCFETNSTDIAGLDGGPRQCWGQGSHGGRNKNEDNNDVNAHVERLKLYCKDFYSSSYNTYSDALGLNKSY